MDTVLLTIIIVIVISRFLSAHKSEVMVPQALNQNKLIGTGSRSRESDSYGV